MFIGSLFLLFAAPKAPLSAKDSSFLSRIDRAVSRISDKKTAFVRFEKTVTKADASRCNQVLSNLKPNSNYYADCAFVQAWYGIDYDKNLYRLQRPIRYEQTKSKRPEDQYKTDWDEENLLASLKIADALNWLHLKHHDLKSLGAWEDLRFDGAPSEANDDELGALWKRHAIDMLKAAYAHPMRIKNLTEALQFA